jgi:hypothetical protein
MSKRSHNYMKAAQAVSLLLAFLLGLALFLSPYRLHDSPASIFFVNQSAASETAISEHTAHSQHDHEQTQEPQCLRCVLYGFQLPETTAPFVVILVVLGFLRVAKPAEPFSFVTRSACARAPPVF